MTRCEHQPVLPRNPLVPGYESECIHCKCPIIWDKRWKWKYSLSAQEQKVLRTRYRMREILGRAE